jgi:hypothetical protein
MAHVLALPDPRKIGGKYLDNGNWRITEATARKLCKPYALPRHGLAGLQRSCEPRSFSYSPLEEPFEPGNLLRLRLGLLG